MNAIGSLMNNQSGNNLMNNQSGNNQMNNIPTQGITSGTNQANPHDQANRKMIAARNTPNVGNFHYKILDNRLIYILLLIYFSI